MRLEIKKQRFNLHSPIQIMLCPFQFVKKSFKKDSIGCCNRWNKFEDCRYSKNANICPLREYIYNEEEDKK